MLYLGDDICISNFADILLYSNATIYGDGFCDDNIVKMFANSVGENYMI